MYERPAWMKGLLKMAQLSKLQGPRWWTLFSMPPLGSISIKNRYVLSSKNSQVPMWQQGHLTSTIVGWIMIVNTLPTPKSELMTTSWCTKAKATEPKPQVPFQITHIWVSFPLEHNLTPISPKPQVICLLT
jgi:hypothetical protein